MFPAMLVKAVYQAFHIEICSEAKRMNTCSVEERIIVCPTENHTIIRPAGILSHVHTCFCIFSVVLCLKVTHKYPEAKLNTEL